MTTPTIFQVKPHQVQGTDINQFLNAAIAAEFGTNYNIVSESTLDRVVPYSKTPRKIKAYAVEAGGTTHSLYFDITEVTSANTIDWLGNR
jgi:hypothetical protein